ncbi:MAG: signal peptide peptidase SppA [Spirochaetales bacterium]|nr:signal peptide peptidase SppA [Spirochaetales bacterium]
MLPNIKKFYPLKRCTMGRFFKKLFRTFNLIQKIFLGILFWGIVTLVIIGLLYNESPKVRDGEVLLVAPTGMIVDEYTQSPYQRELDVYRGDPPRESLLSDLQWVLDSAAYDGRILSVVLDLSSFSGSGPALLEELRRSLARYKESGKPLYVYAPSLTQGALYLAAGADEIVMDPMGSVFIKGYGSYRSYMKDGLDDWGITAHVYRAGENKDFVAPFLSNSMTAGERGALQTWMDDLWETWISETAHSLSLEGDVLRNYSNRYGTLLKQSGLSPAKLAVQTGLVDRMMTYDEFNQLMISRVGLDESGYGYSQSYWTDYIAREGGRTDFLPGPKVALLTLSGEILWGEGDYARMGSYQVEQTLDLILSDPDVAALVLRVDSPGGSAMGAEIIRRKLEKFHNYGIPLFVSIGNMAASGGYWIACEADEIWADSTSLTGSIGVFSYFFTAEDFLKEKAGVNVDGYGTTSLSDIYSLGRDTSSETDKMLQAGVDQIYRQFTSLVSQRRQIPLSELEKLAGGRVWTGRQAQESGLVDHLGGLQDVLDRAADEAALGADYSVVVYDDTGLSPYRAGMDLLPSLQSFLSLPPLVKDSLPLIDLPEDNPFGDPRRVNAWSSYEVIQ